MQGMKIAVLSVAFLLSVVLGNVALKFIPVSFSQACPHHAWLTHQHIVSGACLVALCALRYRDATSARPSSILMPNEALPLSLQLLNPSGHACMCGTCLAQPVTTGTATRPCPTPQTMLASSCTRRLCSPTQAIGATTPAFTAALALLMLAMQMRIICALSSSTIYHRRSTTTPRCCAPHPKPCLYHPAAGDSAVPRRPSEPPPQPSPQPWPC